MPGGPVTTTRPQPVHRPPSHRQQNPKRGRLAAGAGVAAAVAGLGVAVAVGAVPSPLTAASAKPLAAATLATVPSSVTESLLQASASPLGSYALAEMPTPSHKPSPKPTPARTTATPTQPASEAPSSAPPSSQSGGGSGGLTPQPTAEYQTPTGQDQLAWSQAILNALGAPLTSANIVSIGYWMQNEAGKPPYGIVGANNPINVSEPGYGGTRIQYEAPGYYLMSYPSVQQGVQAIVAYLNNGSYPRIVNDLKQGAGLMNDSALASELNEYSGGGYNSIPDSWGQSQGTPLS